MPEMHLKQPGFNYSACRPFTKNKERIQKFKETGDTDYIYRNELDKACFQHDMAYEDFKDLARRTASDKILRDKVFNMGRNPKYDRYQRYLASMVYKFFDKKSASLANKSTKGSGVAMLRNEQLAEELYKPIIKKFKKRRVNSSFKDNIWGANLAEMQLMIRFNKGIWFFLCVIYILIKYTWVVPLKNKKGVTIVDAFQKILDDSMRKPNKIWVDKGSEFSNSLFFKKNV